MSSTKTNEGASDRAQLALKLREARDYVGLSQEEVARILKIPRSAISLMESGERKVDALELQRLADLYQQSTEHFTGHSARPAKDEFPREVTHLARLASKLSTHDRAELLRFTEFLQARAKPKDRL